jgi:hypothetical protein
MNLNTARLGIAIVGILLPYVVRIPGGSAWVRQYTAAGLGGFLFFEAFNAIAWGSLIGLSFLIRRPLLLLVPCGLGFGYLAWAHATLDLAADAQAAIALVFIPFYALRPIAIGGVVGFVLDRVVPHGGPG